MRDKLYEVIERMTEGPWTVSTEPVIDEYDRKSWTVGLREDGDHYEDMICEVFDGEHDGEAHAQLIAAIPAMLLHIETLEAEVERLAHLNAVLARG